LLPAKTKHLNVYSFIARRLAFNQQRAFSRFIIRLSIGATVVSVMVMILAMAFSGGFQKTISEKIFSFWGHIRIQNYETLRVSIAEETPIQRQDSILQLKDKFPQIKTIQSFATKTAILKTTETIEGVMFKAIEEDYDFSNLNKFLVEGRWLNFSDSGYSDEINISASIARRLKLNVNDKLLVYFIQPTGSPRPRRLTVTGIYSTGIEEYDKMIAVCDLKLVQRLNDWDENQIGGYEIFLHNYKDMDFIKEEIYYELPLGLNSNSIKEINPNIFDWLALQNKTIYIVLAIMIAIAVLNLITCLLILVLERTRMVGILKAVGASSFSIQKIFLIQGAIITLSGILLGNVLALLICYLQEKYGFITLPEDFYYISKAAVSLKWWQVLLVDAGTLIVCTLVLLIPSYIVKKIQPVQAISFR